MLTLAAGGRGRKWTGIENGKEASSVSFISFRLYTCCILGMLKSIKTLLFYVALASTSLTLSKKAAYVYILAFTL